MPSQGAGKPVKGKPVLRSRVELMYEMLNLEIPNPFIREQKMLFRKASREDLKNAQRILSVTDGPSELKELCREALSSLYLGTTTIEENVPLLRLEKFMHSHYIKLFYPNGSPLGETARRRKSKCSP